MVANKCKECEDFKGLHILFPLLKEMTKKDNKAIISTYHKNDHNIFESGK